MFGSDYSESMTGQFMLLVREEDYETSKDTESSVFQEKDNGLGNPHKTKIVATFDNATLDGEMVLLDLKTVPPVVAIVKLPCGECMNDFVAGKFYSFSGELQFQKTPQLQFLPGMNISVSESKKISECELTEDIVVVVDSQNVKTC